MKTSEIITAWKHRAVRDQLSDQQRAELPPHPAGEIELTDAACALVGGGAKKNTDIPWACNWTTSKVAICQ